MRKPVAIIGSGPAGLMAAHACKLAGVPFAIFALGEKSNLGGAQFLHRAVPYLNDQEAPSAQLRYLLVGSSVGYKQKVYGDEDVSFVSMQNVQDKEVVDAWSLIETYDELWREFSRHINQVTVGARWIADNLEAGTFSNIISTVPKHAVCLAHAGLADRQHTFVSQRVQIRNEEAFDIPDNTIIYDGTQNVSWYRTSKIFGIGSTEWGESVAEKRLPYKDLVAVKKPLRTDCCCFDGHVVFTGRFGAWQKGKLVHHAFIDAWQAVKEGHPL